MTASSIHRPISLSLPKLMKNEVQTTNQAFHTFRHFWPVCFHSWGKKTVVDMMKRGSTFGELAIIFLIPRKPGSEKTSVLNLWAPWTLVLWDCIFTVLNQVKVGYGLHIRAGCTVAAVALQVTRCRVYCSSVINKFPMTSCKPQIGQSSQGEQQLFAPQRHPCGSWIAPRRHMEAMWPDTFQYCHCLVTLGTLLKS